jgi:phosphonate utilization transcriptional regulator PhnR
MIHNAAHYRLLQQHYQFLISQQALKAGDRLPSEREIGEQFNLTRITVRQALQVLEAEGLIYRQNRRGWFVSPPAVVYHPAERQSFVDYVAAQGLLPRTEVLAQTVTQADASQAALMQTERGTRLVVLRRRRFIDDRPVLIEQILMNAELLPGVEKEDLSQSLTRLLLHRYGQTYHAMDLSFRSTALPLSAAHDLGIAAGLPGLQIERVNYAADGQVLEVDHEFWRHDAVTIRIGVNR